jgi:hypothetical protein
VIGRNAVHPIVGLIEDDEWNAAKAQGFPLSLAPLDHPYHLCMNLCMQQLYHWSINHANGVKVLCMFADHDRYRHYVADACAAYRAHPRWGAVMGTQSFGTPEEIPFLQAADLFAYEVYRGAEFFLGRSTEPRALLRQITRQKPNGSGWYYDRESIRQLIDQGPMP